MILNEWLSLADFLVQLECFVNIAQFYSSVTSKNGFYVYSSMLCALFCISIYYCETPFHLCTLFTARSSLSLSVFFQFIGYLLITFYNPYSQLYYYAQSTTFPIDHYLLLNCRSDTRVVGKWRIKRENFFGPFSAIFIPDCHFIPGCLFDHCLLAHLEYHGAKSAKTFSAIFFQFGYCLPFI